MKKYPYLILFLLTFSLGLPVIWSKLFLGDGTVLASSLRQEKELTEETDSAPEDADIPAEEPAVPVTQLPPEEEIPEEPLPPQFVQIDTDYWSDALFIGDSRMMGLSEYTDLGDSQVFAANGMSTFTLFKKKNARPSDSPYLMELLEQNTYGKIYIMLGLNEIGYKPEEVENQYASVLETLRAAQPDAIIFLCGNMHVSQERSDNDNTFNNQNIDRLNDFLLRTAEENGYIFLDVNEVYDDENGCLNADYTYDGIHVRASHYEEWNTWLKTKGILTEEIQSEQDVPTEGELPSESPVSE